MLHWDSLRVLIVLPTIIEEGNLGQDHLILATELPTAAFDINSGTWWDHAIVAICTVLNNLVKGWDRALSAVDNLWIYDATIFNRASVELPYAVTVHWLVQLVKVRLINNKEAVRWYLTFVSLVVCACEDLVAARNFDTVLVSHGPCFDIWALKSLDRRLGRCINWGCLANSSLTTSTVWLSHSQRDRRPTCTSLPMHAVIVVDFRILTKFNLLLQLSDQFLSLAFKFRRRF